MTDLDSNTAVMVESTDPIPGSPANDDRTTASASLKRSHRPLVTTRVGIFFVATAVAMLVLALIARMPRQRTCVCIPSFGLSRLPFALWVD